MTVLVVKGAAPWPTLLGIPFGVWLTVRAYRLKTVEIEGSELVISNLGREARVPFIKVMMVRGIGNEMMIKFCEETIFGGQIRFLPYNPWNLTWPFTEHPLAAELRQLCGLPPDPNAPRRFIDW